MTRSSFLFFSGLLNIVPVKEAAAQVSISSALNARIFRTNVFFLFMFWLWTNFRTKNSRV